MENKVNVNDIDPRFNCFKATMLYGVSMLVTIITHTHVCVCFKLLFETELLNLCAIFFMNCNSGLVAMLNQ